VNRASGGVAIVPMMGPMIERKIFKLENLYISYPNSDILHGYQISFLPLLDEGML
jgi:hypothetical protein